MKLTDILKSFGRSGLAALVAGGMACGNSYNPSSSEQTKGCVTDDDCHGGRKCEYNSCVYPAPVFDGGEVPVVDKRELCDGWDNDNNGEIDEMGCGSLIYLTDHPQSELRELDLATGVSRLILGADQLPKMGPFAVEPITGDRIIMSTFDDELYSINRWTGQIQSLVSQSNGSLTARGQSTPSFMGIGKILFVGSCYPSCPESQWTERLYLMDFRDTGPTLRERLYPPDGNFRLSFLDPIYHQNKIAVVVADHASGSMSPPKLGIYNLDTKSFARVPIEGDPEVWGLDYWSDADKIFFYGGNHKVYSVSAAGGTPELVTNAVNNGWVYAFSPDRQKMGYMGPTGFCVKDLSADKTFCSNLFPSPYDPVKFLVWAESSR